MARTRKPEPLAEKQREIMNIVWDLGQASVFEVREALSQHRTVARNTVRTMMERLEEKGWLTHRVIGRTYFYSALIPRDVSVGERIVEVIDKVCDGRPESLMSALLDYRGLSAEEIDRIQKLLTDAKKQKSKGKKK